MIDKTRFVFVFIAFLCLALCTDTQAKENVSKSQITKTIKKIKTSAPATRRRDDAALQLLDLTSKINPEDIDDETLNEMIKLLDIPEVDIEIIGSFGNLGSRVEKAVPKLIQIMNDETCDSKFVDLLGRSGVWKDDLIRDMLKRQGIDVPVVNCSGDYAVSNLSAEELRNAATRLTELQGKTGRRKQATSSDRRRNGEIYNPDGIELVYVEGANDGNAEAGKGFYIGKYEITQEQWKVLMGNTPRNIAGDNLPVDYVSWDDVKEFLSRLNVATGRNYRLPTEAEWEFAARGGTADSFCPGGCKYSGSNKFKDVAWLNDEKTIPNRPHPIGSKRPNELGIYDMSGNVWEWCEDRHDRSNVARVVRGCDWAGAFFPPNKASITACRFFGAPDHRYRALGFRVLLPSE